MPPLSVEDFIRAIGADVAARIANQPVHVYNVVRSVADVSGQTKQVKQQTSLPQAMVELTDILRLVATQQSILIQQAGEQRRELVKLHDVSITLISEIEAIQKALKRKKKREPDEDEDEEEV